MLPTANDEDQQPGKDEPIRLQNLRDSIGIHAGDIPAGPVQYSPYVGRNFPTRVYWGNQHMHTAISVDAGTMGGNNLHRNVLFRGDAAQANTTVPACRSSEGWASTRSSSAWSAERMPTPRSRTPAFRPGRGTPRACPWVATCLARGATPR
jgi:hypothetical protein